VSDTGHHRVLGWSSAPHADGADADVLLGQPDWGREGRNAGGEPDALTLNVPVGVAGWPGGGLVVADSWNHRVLVWSRAPTRSHAPPDLVLGQADPRAGAPNRGTDDASAASMYWPSAALVVGGALLVADTGNRRVLVWDTLPTRDGQPADRVLGQPGLELRDDNGGAPPTRATYRWPHGLAVCGSDLVVADAGDNRVLRFRGVPARWDEPAAVILGQPDADSVDHNAGRPWPTAATVAMPYGVAAVDGALVVADTSNSRLLGYPGLRDGEAADRLTGQRHFAMKGDNRWEMPTRDSVCWPYGVSGSGRTVVVADTGNQRVALWDLAAGEDRR
jgi:NHL repeat